MHIEEVIVDGFKSYASRTVIAGFDPEFNAITGLNGSGKSNILDSICFVLGISNLSQVRVGNLQELVYKGGQAGVTKATVSIIFNNSNRAKSPAGYEECDKITVTRQIVIGGRNKYLINGHVAQPGRVQNLFHSVQLNVNNPHFLIMQGRITKVITMKPPEILAMIEEAAGTRMYELKKETALKTIEKKQKKVEEIEEVLAVEITPMLDKLRKDRTSYMKWCSNNSKLERLKRFNLAYEYYVSMKRVLEAKSELKAVAESMESTKKKHKDVQARRENVNSELQRVRRMRESQMSKAYHVLEKEVEERGKALVKLDSVLTNSRETLRGEEENLSKLRNQLSENESEKGAKTKELKEIREAVQTLEVEVQKLTDEEANAQRALLTGTGGGKGGADDAVGSSVVDQIQAAKLGLSNAETEIEQLKMRKNHLKEELKTKSVSLKSDRLMIDQMKQEQSKSEKAIQQVKLKLHELDYDEELADNLSQQLRTEEAALQSIQDKYDQMSARLAAFEFKYSDPVKNFDRSSVKGFVASLLTVRDPQTSTAIEVAAGGKLYQVVVDTEKTGKALLERGNLQKRVTIIPLNKINSSTVSQQQLVAAQKVDPNVSVALSLIGHDDDVEAAMKYVFGRTMVCEDMDTAKKVTFNPQVRCRTVTLDGDLFDPAGTLSGGASSRSSGPSVLELLTELSQVRAELSHRERAVAKIKAQLNSLSGKRMEHEKLKSELELKSHEASLVEKKLGSSSVGRLMKEVQDMEEQLKVKIPEALAEAEQQKTSCAERALELEKSMSDVAGAREKAMRDAEQALEATKTRLAEGTNALRDRREAAESLSLNVKTLSEEIASLMKQIDATASGVSKDATKLRQMEEEIANARDEYEAKKLRMEKEAEKLAKNDAEISSLQDQLNQEDQDVERFALELKRVEHRHKSASSECESNRKIVASLEEKHSWIEAERELFGQEGGDYDFENANPRDARKQLEHLTEEQSSLSKQINKKVMTMFEKAEQEYQDLTSKRRIIENDKRKMEKVIAELDEKKKQALQATWKKVNVDFASIFSTLLPGATAKLEPQEGSSVMDGLEIRVGFGSVWKDSLSELSGGQRSLIALSLVLAMLQFKPAPMYILDEVDAALDLSHTQNIGRMLKNHFGGSQFIVVSLKEGMFNNANVIFRTKFVDGVSTVQRTVNRTGKQRKSIDPSMDKENISNTGKIRSRS